MLNYRMMKHRPRLKTAGRTHDQLQWFCWKRLHRIAICLLAGTYLSGKLSAFFTVDGMEIPDPDICVCPVYRVILSNSLSPMGFYRAFETGGVGAG